MPTNIYSKWRTRPIRWLAKVLGVLVHIEGRPYGSNRIYLRSQNAVGTSTGGHAAVCTNLSPSADCPCWITTVVSTN